MNNFDFFNFISFPLLFKIVFLFLVFLYILFTLIIYKQVHSMNQIISEIHSSYAVKIISSIGVIAAIMLFLIAFVIL